jgi:alanyl-tRNA synthetase
MTAQEIRQKYLEFMKQQGHVIVPRANLVPEGDATTLFTGSGMQPMVPYLLGETHPEGTRIADSQTVLRAEDIEEVGDNRHFTLFEMLGNWGLGDYYKQEEIPWLWGFLVDVVGLNPSKLYVTCFIGDSEHNIPKDTESAGLWQKLFTDKGIDAPTVDIGSEADGAEKGMQGGRIFYYDGKKNWWSRGGGPASKTPVGDPGGPDTEVFYEFSDVEHDSKFGKHCHPNCDCGRYLEIGNSVFMAYKRTKSGFESLPKPNVDFGGGLERIAAAVRDDPDTFKISLLWPIIEELEKISGKAYDSHKAEMRFVSDHLRAAVWLAIDGVVPSNTAQGYVMRRLMRRAIRYGLELGIASDFCAQLVPVVVSIYAPDFPEVVERQQTVLDVFNKEERVFRQTLKNGVKEFNKMTTASKLTGEHIFKLYDTYGFPVELSVEEAAVHDVDVDANWQKEFDRLMQEQKERSRTATQGQFKGGLGGHSDTHKKYHTATHLLYKALRLVLGDQVVQRGSNITEERLRFDFSHPEKVTSEQISEIEKIVNEQIEKDWPMGFTEMSPEEAFASGALGAFGDKYPDKVKVYTAGDPDGEWFSREICGGPHVDRTGELGINDKKFKILKEEASSAGIRRIKAVLQ